MILNEIPTNPSNFHGISCISGDEVLEWNGHPLVGKSYDEVHDVIAESRHDTQVELRVARSLMGGHAPSIPYQTDPLGRPLLEQPQSRAYPTSSAAAGCVPVVPPTSAGFGPSVTLSDPLGGTTHMLQPPHPQQRHQGSTRIQVGHLHFLFTS